MKARALIAFTLVSAAAAAGACALLDEPHHDGSALYVSDLAPRLGATVRVRLRVPNDNGFTGVHVRLAPDGPKVVGNERAGRLVMDGDVILPADGATINERRRIAAYGQISVAVALDGAGRVQDTAVRLQGIPVEEDKDDFVADACDAAEEAARKGGADEEKLRESIRLAVRRKAVEWTGKKPVVDVMILRV